MIDTSYLKLVLASECSVRLADGNLWHVPAPDEGDLACPHYRSILALLGGGDPEERQLAETILAIYLLDREGGRGPAEIRHLLGVGADEATRAALAEALRRVAEFHLNSGPAQESRPDPRQT